MFIFCIFAKKEIINIMAKTEKTKGTGCLAFTLIGIPVIIFILLMAIWAYRSYNKMVSYEEIVNSQWAQVENTYQRRSDLIFNLAETVKGYAAHENSTYTNVIEARSKATAIQINPENLDEAELGKFQEAQDGLSSAFSKLMVVVENYPELKAIESFIKLQNQLEEIENTILAERNAFNAVAKDYNVYIRKFPKNIFASWFGFENIAYFKAKEGTDEAPRIDMVNTDK